MKQLLCLKLFTIGNESNLLQQEFVFIQGYTSCRTENPS